MPEETNKTIKFADIQAVFDSFLLMKDRDVVRLTIATIIGNQMPNRRPIWLMLVAPPSSGKTTVLNSLLGLEVTKSDGTVINPIMSISDITPNSFASGSIRSDKETSLLFKMPWGGVMVFKDFTSILSKAKEAKEAVMGQMREIYDGAYSKKTGTGEDITWKGKIGALGGVTQTIYSHLESLSTMGDRFMLYEIPQPDRKEALRFKLQQEEDGKTEDIQMPIASALVHKYIQQVFDKLQTVKVKLKKEHQNEIIDVADFCTMVRSGIIMNDYTGTIVFKPEAEMPMRMFEQMLALGGTLLLMKMVDEPENTEPYLEQSDFNMIYKIAYDSIPVVRRIALTHLAKYSSGVDTAGLATKTNYPTKVVQGWLEQLNALGVVDRVKHAGFGNRWRLKPEYQDIMFKLQGVKATEELLTEDNAEENEVEDNWNKLKERESIDEENIQEAIEGGNW